MSDDRTHAPASPSSPADSGDDRWDALLLAAGFNVDPDASLAGRIAAEVAASPDATGNGADTDTEVVVDAPDPWADHAIDVGALTDDQRSYVETASPALGAALPAQSLTGDDPFADVSDESLASADDDVIDFD